VSATHPAAPEMWLHFSAIPEKGAEGVMIFHRDDRVDRVLLVDGSADQVDQIQRWSAQRSKSSDGRRLELTWVASHYHHDHVSEGHKLIGGDAEKHLYAVWVPQGNHSRFPDDKEEELRDLGPKLAKWHKQALVDDSKPPYVRTPELGDLGTIWNFGSIRVEVFGGPYRSKWPKRSAMNARSLIVIGSALRWRADIDPPFSFVLPGDAGPPTWSALEEVLDRQTNITQSLPVALLKLSHHGSGNSNPPSALERLFGDTSYRHRAHQRAVRVLNAPVPPAASSQLQGLLDIMGIKIHDTRSEGELWVRVRCGEPMVLANDKNDVALGLPACFRS